MTLFIIAVCNKTIVAFSCVVLFKGGRSLIIALSPSIVRAIVVRFVATHMNLM